ncbi:MAG: FkbM family methyltransferase [Planctomycetes bacterium]|nr:FkbM family methyltransferase [Planctomycetota bacterium]
MNPEQQQAFIQEVRRAFAQLDHKHTAMQGGLRQQMIGLRRRLYALETMNQLQAAGRTSRYPLEFRAQHNEDCMVYDLFARQPTGYFIEVGAFDGYEFSVSYALECIGWTGLLIEAIPRRAQACKERRKHSRVVHSALGKRGCAPTANFTVVDDHWGGMLSFNTTDEETRRRFVASRTPSQTVTVPQNTMDALLEQDPNLANYGHEVDLASIDVEGGEIDVLQGFDLNRWKPKVILLEDNHDQSENSAVARYMKEQDYHHAGWLDVNRIYIRNDLKEWGSRLSQWW